MRVKSVCDSNRDQMMWLQIISVTYYDSPFLIFENKIFFFISDFRFMK